MNQHADGLKQFAAEISDSVVREIRGWQPHPELRRILLNLQSHTSRKAFFDTYAEAMVARRLISRGCDIRFEVPTPAGRRTDFEVARGGQTFYLHVKRIDSDHPPRESRAIMKMSARLRVLERIKRPYIVQVRWRNGLRQDQMQQLVAEASEFLLHARVGDELRSRGENGRELGGVRVLAPWEGSHVNVTIGLPSGSIDLSPRIRKLLNRAYQQFMPKGTNVILICCHHPEDQHAFETALLGTHIERWDAFPPRGRRVAHGRADDGFWFGKRFADSRFAAWTCFDPRESELQSRLWTRTGLPMDTSMHELLMDVFS